MTVRKTVLAASAAALMSTPVWAIPSQASPSNANGNAPKTRPVGPPGNRPADEHGLAKGEGHSGAPSTHGKQHKCAPHKVAFIVSGKLVEVAGFHENTDGTFSGEMKLTATHKNHHAASEASYTLTNVHVTFGLSDANGDGKRNLEDVRPGDRVKLIGKLAQVTRKCPKTTAAPTLRKVIFNASS
jgi:hypothetical protein